MRHRLIARSSQTNKNCTLIRRRPCVFIFTKRRDKNMLKYIAPIALIATLAQLQVRVTSTSVRSWQIADCLAHYCGWCSPYPVVYENGTKGARCGDQRDAPGLATICIKRSNVFAGTSVMRPTGSVFLLHLAKGIP